MKPVRHDGGKPRMDLLPIDVTELLRPYARADLSASAARARIDRWYCQRGSASLLSIGTATMLLHLAGHHELGAEGAIAEVMSAGLNKYGAHNWRFPPGLAYSRIYAATVRHRIRHRLAGEAWPIMTDTETDCPHIWHEIWGYLVLCTYMEYDLGVDDRPPKTHIV